MGTTRRQVIQGAAAVAGLATAGAPALLKAQTQPLRVGLIYALSGPYAVASEPIMKGAQLAIAQYNNAGGLLGRPIEGVVRDDKFSGAGSIAAVRELAGSGINLMLGGSASVTALAALPLLQELNTLFIVSGAAAMGINHQNFSRYAFRTLANTYVQYGGLGRAMAERFPTVMKWQVVIPDSTFGRDTAKVFSATLRQFHANSKSKDFEVREPMLVGGSQTDFRSQINTLMNSGVEGLFFAAVGAPTISFFQQARAVGLDKKLKAMCEGNGDTTAKALGKDMPASFWGPVFWPHQVEPYKSNKLSQQLYKDWVAATKDPNPPTTMNLGYRAAQALFEGIKKAKSTDTEALIKAMEGLTWESTTGSYRIRKEDHQSIGTVFFANYVPSDKEPYYEIKSVKAVSEESVIESPSPGAEYII